MLDLFYRSPENRLFLNNTFLINFIHITHIHNTFLVNFIHVQYAKLQHNIHTHRQWKEV